MLERGWTHRRPSGFADETPTRFLHDCRRTAARNLIRASVPERVAMLLTGPRAGRAPGDGRSSRGTRPIITRSWPVQRALPVAGRRRQPPDPPIRVDPVRLEFPILSPGSKSPCESTAAPRMVPVWRPCSSRIRCQAATGSWTKSRQWETERTLFSSARATHVSAGEGQQRVALQRRVAAYLVVVEARRQAPRNGASIVDSAREFGIRGAQADSPDLTPHCRGPGATAGAPRPDSPLVFHRDGIPIRRWRTAWRTACQAAGVPTRFLHDCRRTAARNLIRASVPERVAMLLTGHKTRAIFDRDNIINEQELLEAGDQLVAYLAQHAQATPRGRAHPASPRPAPPLGVVARIVTGPHDAHRQDPHLPMRYDTGRPRAVIRLRISQPRTTSLACLAGLRARRPSPMMDLYRKNVFSTRP